MKTLSSIVLLALASLTSHPVAFAEWVDIPAMVETPVEGVFLPVGFDDNDNVEIVLRGTFPSTCFTLGHATARVDQALKRIVVKAESIFHIGSPCAELRVPFIQTVKLGLLEAGNYSVRVEGSTFDVAPFPVKRAIAETMDDYMYAHVQTVSMSRSGQGLQTLTLKGTHPIPGGDKCVVMKKVNIEPIQNGVVVVQPITEIVSGAPCRTSAANPYFSTTVTLETEIPVGALVHVRAMHGQSTNYLVR